MCLRKSSTTSTAKSEGHRASSATSLGSIQEKSGLKVVVGTVRYIVKDDNQLAHVGDMIDEMDSDGTKGLARALAWTLLTYPSSKSSTDCLVLNNQEA